MKLLFTAATIALVLSAPASAQTTTNCTWVGSVWTCNQSAPRPGVDWNASSRAGNSYNDSLQRGLAVGEQIRRARQERERLKLEQKRLELDRQLLEQRRSEAQVGSQDRSVPSQGTPAPSALTQSQIQAWLDKARPRMARFPDFEKIVFDNGVNITPDMVILMTGSDYAADIAYYLGTHRAEATAISRLPMMDAARALDEIEARLRAAELPTK